MKIQFFKKSVFVKAVVSIITGQFLFFGLPFDVYASFSGQGNLRGRSGIKGNVVKALTEGEAADGGVRVRAFDDLMTVIKEKKITSGFDIVDLNDDLTKSDAKTAHFMQGLIGLLNEDAIQEIFVTSHMGRAEGDYIKDLSLEQSVDKVDQFLDFAAEKKGFEFEKGKSVNLKIPRDNVVITLLPYNLGEALKMVKEVRKKNKGKKMIFVIENIRFYPGEKSEDKEIREAFQDSLAALTGKDFKNLFVLHDAFEKAHRGETDASVEIISRFPVENRGASRALEGNIKLLDTFQSLVIGTLSEVYGGKKFDKFTEIAKAVKNVEERAKKLGREARVFIIGALLNPIAKKQGYEIGHSAMPKKEGDVNAFEKAWPDIEAGIENGVVELPRTVLARKGDEVSDVEVVKKGEDREGTLRHDMKQFDIGSSDLQKIVNYIGSLKEGDGVVINGGAGVFEEEDWQEGTFAIIEAASKAADNGVIVLFAGADMNKALGLYEKRTGKKISAKAFKTSGGGVVLRALNEGVRNLSSVAALMMDTSTGTAYAKADGGEAAAIADAVGMEVRDVQNALLAESTVYKEEGGDFFTRYMDRIKKARESLTDRGYLKEAKITAEIIHDSRGKSTVRARLQIGNREVTGDVPAGASKGGDEADTVDTEKAIINIERIIAPILQKSDLDLSKHEDLIRAEQMIIEAAGDNFKDLGANATVPVSWALWKMAASLHDMKLWEYIRWYNPQLWPYINGDVKFYMNIFNGGLHALKKEEGETLGKDRIDIQEIMIVPVAAKSYKEALAWGDKIDQALKKILENEFGKELVSRADEAGFSVKGLGNSEEAIGYVVQAIEDAGFKPGEEGVQIAFDVAATTFYKKETGYYEFQGNKRTTAQDMTNFYRKIAEKYPGVIRTVEDGLDENDWKSWPEHKRQMEELGIGTIGDDLFVTQLGRLKKGIETKAASKILIKVNQNGSLLGTLKVVFEAYLNGMDSVVSHRSGETEDPAIADLAFAIGADALKTGAPQPEEDFKDHSEWVRRNKYLRMVAIEKEPQMNGRTLILSDELFKTGGAIKALSEAGVLNDELAIAIYGEKADALGAILGIFGNKGVITGENLNEVVSRLNTLGVKSENRMLQRTEGDDGRFAINIELSDSDLREMVIRDLSTLMIAKALKELINEYAEGDFESFYSDLVKQGIISEEDEELYRAEFAQLLELGETLHMEGLGVTVEVSEKVDAEKKEIAAFVTQI